MTKYVTEIAKSQQQNPMANYNIIKLNKHNADDMNCLATGLVKVTYKQMFLL